MLQSKNIQWLNGFKKKQDPCIYCLQETYIRSKDTHEPKEWVWENIFQANEKKAGTVMLTSDNRLYRKDRNKRQQWQ